MAALPLPSCRFAAIHLPQGDGFSSKGKLCGSAKGVPLGELARRKPCLRGYCLNSPSLAFARQPPLRWGLWHGGKASGATAKCPAAPEAPSPRELSNPQSLTEGVNPGTVPLPSCRFAAIHLPQGDGFSGKGKLCGSAKGVPLGELARRKPCLRGYTLKLPQSPTATDSPFCRCATSSPGRGKSSSEMGSLA